MVFKITYENVVPPYTRDDIEATTDIWERLRKRDEYCVWLLNQRKYCRKVVHNEAVNDYARSVRLSKTNNLICGGKKMKWIDKFGNTVEGTVEEYQELMGIKTIPAIKSIPVPVVVVNKRTDTKPIKGTEYTRAEKKIIKDNPTMLPSDLLKLLPGRNIHTIYNLRCRLGTSKRRKQHGLKRDSFVNIRPRMRFMANKINFYMRQYNWSRSKSAVQASMDWDVQRAGGVLHVPVKDTPPVVEHVHSSSFYNKGVISYKLVRVLKDEGRLETVNVFTDLSECEKQKSELEIADQSINNNTQYLILRKVTSDAN